VQHCTINHVAQTTRWMRDGWCCVFELSDRGAGVTCWYGVPHAIRHNTQSYDAFVSCPRSDISHRFMSKETVLVHVLDSFSLLSLSILRSHFSCKHVALVLFTLNHSVLPCFLFPVLLHCPFPKKFSFPCTTWCCAKKRLVFGQHF